MTNKIFFFWNNRFKMAIGLFMTVTVSAFSIFSMFFNNYFEQNSNKFFKLFLIIIFLWIFSNLICQICRKKIKLDIGQVNIEVKKGNLFEEKEIIIIPCDSEYTLEVDDIKISKKSIQGIFIEKNKKHLSSIMHINHSKLKKLEVGDKIYYLFPLCEFNGNKAEMSRNELNRKFIELWDEIDSISNSNKISIPLIGSGQLRISPSMNNEELLKLILNSIEIFGFCKKTNISIILYNSGININKIRSNNEI